MTRIRACNIGLNAMGAEVVNSTFVLLFGICAKLNICTSNSPTSASPKPLPRNGLLLGGGIGGTPAGLAIPLSVGYVSGMATQKSYHLELSAVVCPTIGKDIDLYVAEGTVSEFSFAVAANIAYRYQPIHKPRGLFFRVSAQPTVIIGDNGNFSSVLPFCGGSLGYSF